MSASLLTQIAQIIRLENAFYVRNRRLLAAALTVAFIPAIYVLIYLSSVWDPVSHTVALPVALVNLDQDVQYRERSFNLGNEITQQLKSRQIFGYVDIADADTARHLVRNGRMAFAVIIPADFSANAVPGMSAGAGRIEVVTSEGNSYQGAALARRFADQLGEEVNDRLNERRWQLVLLTAAGSAQNLEQLNTAVASLKNGGDELAKGSIKVAKGAKELHNRQKELTEGVVRLTNSVQEVGGVLRTLESKQPPAADVQRLKSGSEELVKNQHEMAKGLSQLKTGSSQLRTGLTKFRDETQDSVFVGQKIQEGATHMADGMIRLDDGLQAATVAQRQLTDGATKLSDGVIHLADGALAQGEVLHKIVANLPADSQLTALATGASRIRDGAEELSTANQRLREGSAAISTGLELLSQSLPTSSIPIEGSAEGLSHSVQPQLTNLTDVPNNGSAYAPNIIPAALWLGAGIAAFLIHVRVLPRQARSLPRLAQLIGKIAMPATIVTIQAALVLMAVTLLLQLEVVNLMAVALILMVTAHTFLMIVFFLTRAFGDAGKALSILFLAVQLSSSGGVLPVELSGGIFEQVSPWLPLTWVVKALKAAMFGAFDEGWLFPLLAIALAGALFTLLAAWVGRWRYVEQEHMRPAIEL